MNPGYYLNSQPLTRQTQSLHIFNWDGPQDSSRGFRNINSIFRTICANQKGETATALFDNDFVNYTSGYILCVNTPVLIGSTFGAASSVNANSLLGSLVFTVVRMPEEFIGNQAILSSKYAYGENLKVYFAYELNSLVSQNPDGLSVGASYVSPISQSSSRQAIVPRDMNIKGRAVKGASTGGGGGIGVWS